MHDDENMHKFFAYLNFVYIFMITLVIGSNLLVLFIGGRQTFIYLHWFWHKTKFNDAAKSIYYEQNRFRLIVFILGSMFSTLEYATLKPAGT
jgi:NADH-quinone oxidoreductase subunit L